MTLLTHKNNSSHNPDSKEKSLSQNPNIVDILLGRKEASKIVDSDTLIKNVQNRINNALENGYQYTKVIDSSDKFLRKNVFQQINMAVLYVDLVGSTKMSMSLPPEKLSTLISSFSQEMAYVIEQFNGNVLKFSGDAVIGYFVEDETNTIQTLYNAVACAESMTKVVHQGINPILVKKAGLSEISIKISIDYGKNVVVRYGSDEKKAHVDLLGPTMNVASNIQVLTKPNQILVGQEVYDRLDISLKDFFSEVTKEFTNNWQQYSKNSNQTYRIYRYKYD
ncbi:MAG: adenylate/guanylate cyclase domain-containing protein [Nitrosopumilaceae archaeon]